ncbi:MAG: PAS domain-containing protein [Chloroflexi bacterium]|nr:PAS domain-containing protein [Chloroflexota bacterium]
MEEEAKTKKQSSKEPARQKDKRNPDPPAPNNTSPATDSMRDFFKLNCPVGQQIPHSICLIDHEGKIITINPYLEQLLGFSRAEVCGKRITDFVSQPVAKEFMDHVRKSGQETAGPFIPFSCRTLTVLFCTLMKLPVKNGAILVKKC